MTLFCNKHRKQAVKKLFKILGISENKITRTILKVELYIVAFDFSFTEHKFVRQILNFGLHLYIHFLSNSLYLPIFCSK